MLTSARKGKLVLAQSGGITAVINASLVAVVRRALEAPGIEAIYGARQGILGLLSRDFVDLGREPAENLERLRFTPSAALGSCRHRPSEEEIGLALDVLMGLGVRYFLYIGGNDSAETAHRLHQAAASSGYELGVVVVPKTIDNDLPLTDHTPGYGSAARFVAISTLESGLDTEGMAQMWPVKVMEVMGRNAGWLAAASALGKREARDAPHLIYFPEAGVDPAAFLNDVRTVQAELGYALAVVSETVRDREGRPLGEGNRRRQVDSFGHPYFESPVAYLCQLVEEELGLRTRFDKPGSLQRTSTAHLSSVDVEEAGLVGRSAVAAALAGESDKMVTLVREGGERYLCRTGLAPLAEVANRERRLPPHFMNDERNFVTPAFLDYARPLLGEPLPRFARLRAPKP